MLDLYVYKWYNEVKRLRAGEAFMSHSILRIERVKTHSDVTGIQKHVQRETKNYANKDIDKSKTELNYDLLNESQIDFNERVSERLENGYTGKRKVRSDAIKLVDGIITSDNKFFDELSELEQKDFFEHGLEFVKEEFGAENIIYATVHLDERTPHMHFGFVPLTEDGRLSAKEVIGNKKRLSSLQDKFNDYLNERNYDLQRGESSLVSKRKHLEMSEFKNQTKYHEKELESVKSDLMREFERLESLSSITPVKVSKNKENSLNQLESVEKVELRALNRVDPEELKKLHEKVDELIELVRASNQDLKEKEIQIVELADLNKQLNRALKDQSEREKELIREAVAREEEIRVDLQEKYEDLSNNVEKRAKEINENKIVTLKNENLSLTDMNQRLEKDLFDVKKENSLLVEENESLKTKYDQLLEKFELAKSNIESAYFVAKDFIKVTMRDQFERMFNRFRVDYDDDLLEHTDVPEDYKNEIEEHLAIDEDPDVQVLEKDLNKVKKKIYRERNFSDERDLEL